MVHRVHVVADGFNLYYSIRAAIREVRTTNEANKKFMMSPILASDQLRWLDIRSLCKGYLVDIGSKFGCRLAINDIHYFSAFSRKDGPETVARHMEYVSALAWDGVRVNMARFQNKDITCPYCKCEFVRPEEKETDVAIGAKIIELAVTKGCEVIFLLTGDTDQIPAIEMARRFCPDLKIVIGFPFQRESDRLKKVADAYYEFDPRKYRKAQFPDIIGLPHSILLERPLTW